MPLEIIRQDITKMSVDAIVNAANTALQMGGGVCGAIFKAAGVDKLQAACNKLAPIQTGEAVITPVFNLPAKYIIHTAGPVYRDGKHGEAKLLRSCYVNSLKRALENNCESVAFPLISSEFMDIQRTKLSMLLFPQYESISKRMIWIFILRFSVRRL
jgi:O-acetyl-ADP-ribose deacetylase (regulator of RNase III)